MKHPSFPLSFASREPQPLARSVIAILVDSSRPSEAHPTGEVQSRWVLTAFPSVSILPVSLASKFFLSYVIIYGLESSQRRFPRTEKMNCFSTTMCMCFCWYLGHNWSNSLRINQRSFPWVSRADCIGAWHLILSLAFHLLVDDLHKIKYSAV